uniref:Beta-3-deoxy-D-manno-oct-2-ulosonic acid transferase n=1 Tax=OCS116 cluster bacterium TaxID=2030921 RepID=A0A2A4YY93_9PROT
MPQHNNKDADEPSSRRLFVYNGGFLTQTRLRRILALSGWDVRLGTPGPGDWVGQWGQSPTSPRAQAVAEWADAPVLTVEDAFLRSVLPGREGSDPIGLHLDTSGVHFDASTPSDLEKILLENPLDDAALLARARAAIAQLRANDLSKYNIHDPALPPPPPGYVLVIDQTENDASVKASKANRNRFLEMLFVAREEHPAAQIIIKTHPETQRGLRDGHYIPGDGSGDITFLDSPVSPWQLLDGAIAVYTVSSQMGFEAIIAGHKPVVFGQPFYVGWGLSDDRMPVDRRQRHLTRAQLFAAAMILYPRWYDPFHDRLCTLEQAIAALSAETRAWRDDQNGWVASGMRLWKFAPLNQFFGRYKPVRFAATPAKALAQTASGQRLMVWANKITPELADAVRVEDGFLRSRGLGAELTPPLSLVLDDLGIYFDPTAPSRLEQMITKSTALDQGALLRAERLIAKLRTLGLSKYNQGGGIPEIPRGKRLILVPGQVEDDASILRGAGEICTNAALIAAARGANPDALILYKPHPDVEAGLRTGAVPDADQLADIVLQNTDPAQIIDAVDEVWTMTSLMGFEALLRGKKVTCLGQPFYAGWGLTRDLGPAVARRTARPSLAALAHATLIDYPRYYDPVTRLPCPVEIAVERLAQGGVPRPGRLNRILAKAQGLRARFAYLWR